MSDSFTIWKCILTTLINVIKMGIRKLFLFVSSSHFFFYNADEFICWKHLVCILTFNDSIATVWLHICSCLCASQIDHQPLGKLTDYFEWILKPRMMCLAAFYSFAYSQCKAIVTGLDQFSVISPSVWAPHLQLSRSSPFTTSGVRAMVCIWRRKE